MKKRIYTIALTCLTAGALFTGCSEVDMANVNQGHNNAASNSNAGVDFMSAGRSCKDYMAGRFSDFPNAAFSIDARASTVSNGVVHVPVHFKWDEPLVDERGECIVVNGIVKNYRVF